ncbi:MAG: hypothetical protein ACKOQP_03025 [Bacteroidota bacterium]
MQHKFIIYGKGEVPTFVKSWLMDHGINDYQLKYSDFSFTGTEKDLSNLIKSLHKNEVDFKVIGIENQSDINVVVSAEPTKTGWDYFVAKEWHQDTRIKITPEMAFKIYLSDNYHHRDPDTMEKFLKNVQAYRRSVTLRKTKFAHITNSQFETSWSN